MKLRALVVLAPAVVIAIASCSSKGGGAASSGPVDAGLSEDAAASAPALLQTLNDLAAFGDKHVGTDAGVQAGDYVFARFQAAGLEDVQFESFDFPRYDLDSSSLTMSVNGAAATAIGYDVFEASGTGSVDADVVYVGDATPQAIQSAGGVTGKIALVDRDLSYHRATQTANVAAAGGIALIMGSEAPDNLRQVGSVRWAWETKVAIPTVTIGMSDAQTFETALTATPPQNVHATLSVQSHSTPAQGRNVVGVLKGTDSTQGEIVIGAHYDTWFAGSTDNGGGIASVIAIAERRALRKRPAPTVVFVGYDGEEVALFGGYHFLRTHRILNKETILAVLNLETPSSASGGGGLAYSDLAGLNQLLITAGLNDYYSLYATMGTVPQLFGGIIPTDIQGIYRNGVPTVSTAVNGPYYHTTQDTPDKVNLAFLSGLDLLVDGAIDDVAQTGPMCCSGPDSEIWQAAVTLGSRAETDPIVATAVITDATGAPQVSVPASATLLYDDFFPAGAVLSATTDSTGTATFTFPASIATQGTGQGTGTRWVDVTAGPSYPLCEQLVLVP
jgi:Zn-dependent M28 family amino/carboxypeptidase